MTDILQNQAFTFYVYLQDASQQPVTGLTDIDVVARVSKAGGLTSVQTLMSFFSEVDLTDEPGVYFLNLPATVADTLGSLHISLRPVVASTFETVRLTFEVVANSLQDILDVLKPILGLSQQNHRFDQLVYDAQGNLTSGRIRLFDDATNTQAGTNPFATYQVQATFDTQGRLQNYQVFSV